MTRYHIVVLLIFAFLAGCNDGASGNNPGPLTLFPRSYGACPIIDNTLERSRSAEDCSSVGDTGSCTMHSECDEQSGGFCSMTEWNDSCACYYHECENDADCPADQACVCGDGSSMISRVVRTCVESCRSDDDCAEGHKCVKAGELVGCYKDKFYGVAGYRCTGDEDECRGHLDCDTPEEEKYSTVDLCVFDEQQGHFACETYKERNDISCE